MADRPNTTVRQLDRPTELASAKRDPGTFVKSDGLLVIDEIQRAPDLVLPIKAWVDDDNRPGQFLLTGSARLLGLQNLPDSPNERSETIERWPFSQGELHGRVERFVDLLFSDDPLPSLASTASKSDYVNRALMGGYPEATKRTAGRRETFPRRIRRRPHRPRHHSALWDPAAAGPHSSSRPSSQPHGHDHKRTEHCRNARRSEVDRRSIPHVARRGLRHQAIERLGDVSHDPSDTKVEAVLRRLGARCASRQLERNGPAPQRSRRGTTPRKLRCRLAVLPAWLV